MCAEVKRQSPKDRPPCLILLALLRGCAGSGFINKCGFDFP